ncbi:zinc finger and SCAN domain-containing protein 10-like isoform X2 [Malaya genurostris]|nr:zinc finger and SCAN domain-containing protein 10-like isoform X2 [Malaya genurostris]
MRCRVGDEKLRVRPESPVSQQNIPDQDEPYANEELPDKIVDELMELPATEPKNPNEILADLMTRGAEEIFDEIIEEELYLEEVASELKADEVEGVQISPNVENESTLPPVDEMQLREPELEIQVSFEPVLVLEEQIIESAEPEIELDLDTAVSSPINEVVPSNEIIIEQHIIDEIPAEFDETEHSSLEGEEIVMEISDNVKEKSTKKEMFHLPPKDMIVDREDHGDYAVIYYDGVSCCGCEEYFPNTQSLKEHCQTKHHLRRPSKTHYCELCHSDFPSLNYKIRHTSLRADPKLYVCHLCNYICRNQGAIDRHMKCAVLHNRPMLDFDLVKQAFDAVQVEGHLCCECFLIFSDETLLDKHLTEYHRNNKPNIPEDGANWCPKCHQVFKQNYKYDVHLRNATASVIYCCKQDFCSYRTASIVFARFHLRSQDHNRVIEPKSRDDSDRVDNSSERRCCFRKCPKSFKSQEALMDHVNKVHHVKRLENKLRRKESTNVCTVCNCNFGSRKALKLHHQAKPKDFVCDQCGLAVGSSFELQLHVQKIHDTIEDMRVFECDECWRSFMSDNNLRRHKEKGHLRNGNCYTCPICGKQFAVKENLWTHWRGHNQTEKFECQLCKSAGKRYLFRDKRTLNRHFRISAMHGSKRNHKCSYENCTKAYRHRLDLQRHEAKVHEGKRPFVCTVCDKGFIRNRDLRLHERMHTLAKLFTCEICQEGFDVYQKYKDHCKDVHGFVTMIQYVPSKE